MNSKVLLSSVGLGLIGAAVLISFINDGFGNKVFVAHKTGAVTDRSMGSAPAMSPLMGADAASTLVGAPTVPLRMGGGGIMPVAGNTASPSFRAAAALPAAQRVELSPQAAFRPHQQAPQAVVRPDQQAPRAAVRANPWAAAAPQPIELFPQAPQAQLAPQAIIRPDQQATWDTVRANPRTAPQTVTPGNFIPKKIALSEAHWQGMDTMRLTSELRRKLKFPRGLQGIMIYEVTLNSANSGFLAGDVIVKVNNDRVTTLEEFQQSSPKVRNLNRVPMTVLRKGDKTQDGRFAITQMILFLRAEPDLGIAQVEAAPMIAPGDVRPHPYRGACTNCHTIGIGFELTPDPDMIILPPPTITKATADMGVSPHLDRGPCVACHTIMF